MNIKYIMDQVKKSKQDFCTSLDLKRIVLSVVEKELDKKFDGNYSQACLQSSETIRRVLSEIGIRSVLVRAHVCMPQSTKGSGYFSTNWGGFWNEEHHIVIVTEFLEIVDLTIKHLHLHPVSSDKNYCQGYPVWWSMSESWPYELHYSLETKITYQLNENETYFLEDLCRVTLDSFINEIEKVSFSDTADYHILEGIHSLDALLSVRDEWALKFNLFHQEELLLPPWLEERKNMFKEKMSRLCEKLLEEDFTIDQ